MKQLVAEGDLYHGLRQAEATLPASAYFDPAEYQRDLDAIWYRRWVLVCRAADIARAAGIPRLQDRHAGNPGGARRDRRAARLPQHLPPSRLAALQRERRHG